MKKMIYIFLLFLSINIFSSDWEFGVKAGLNNSYIDIDNYVDKKFEKNQYGYQLGMLFKKDINNFLYFQIEALYNRKGFQLTTNESEISYKLYTIQFPLVLGVKYFNFEFNSGFYLEKYITSYKFRSYLNEDVNDKEEWGSLDNEMASYFFGGLVGIIYRFNNFIFELRYNYQITESVKSGFSEMDTSYSARMDSVFQWSFNIGYFF